MDYRKQFRVEPGVKPRLAKIDSADTGKHTSHEQALPKIQKHVARMAELQYLLYADANQSLLIVLQALDAAGKDGVIRHLFTGMNPQGRRSSASSSRARSRPRTIFSGGPMRARRAGARSRSSIAPITKTCWSCASTSSRPDRSGRSAMR